MKIRISLIILISLMIPYLVGGCRILANWYEHGKMEKEIRIALENYLTSYCNSSIEVTNVKIEHVPTGFMTIGEDDQEWYAHYIGSDGQERWLIGSIYSHVNLGTDGIYGEDGDVIVCNQNKRSKDINNTIGFDRSKQTFVDGLGTETGYIGIRESGIILMKIFGVLIVIVFILSVCIELLIRFSTKKRH